MFKFSDLIYTRFTRFMGTYPGTAAEQDTVLRDFKQAHLFIVDETFFSYAKGQPPMRVDSYDVMLDKPLPFRNCFFELGDKEMNLIAIADDKQNITGSVFALLAAERSPGEVFCIAICEMNGKPQIWRGTITEGVLSQDPSMRAVSGLLRTLCEYIHNCNLGLEHVHKTVNYGTPGRKCLGKLESFIRLSPKKNHSYPAPMLTSKIDWTVAWFVRGHWRHLNGVGKDRAGSYTVNGFTWVTEHLRGNTEGPIKKHIYEIGSAHA